MQDTSSQKSKLIEALLAKSKNYTEANIKAFSIDFLNNVIKKINLPNDNPAKQSEFEQKTENILHLLPEFSFTNKVSRLHFQKELSSYKQYIQKEYKLVSKGYYVSLFSPIAIALGVTFGVLFKNMALGISLGLLFGVAIGGYMDTKAGREDRIC